MQRKAGSAGSDPPFRRLPDVDCEKHPLYARAGGQVGVLDRLLGYAPSAPPSPQEGRRPACLVAAPEPSAL